MIYIEEKIWAKVLLSNNNPVFNNEQQKRIPLKTQRIILLGFGIFFYDCFNGIITIKFIITFVIF